MYDSVRYVILGLLFAGLFAVWLWSRKQAAERKALGKELGASFRILQKRWLDKGTGVCLIEAEERTFLLAYTAGGGVSWQEVAPKAEEPAGTNRLPAAFQFPE
ncbi:MAG TPA: hypothetical protein VHY09_09270 [Candidatus Methylacidiphilales bacterium]|jgi:hypothetical protein|nr:hypothetical protein [Candidatus Methylacidiphilales bacterium]